MNQIHPQVLKYTNIRTCYTSFLFLPDKWTNAFYRKNINASTHPPRANSRKLAQTRAPPRTSRTDAPSDERD